MSMKRLIILALTLSLGASLLTPMMAAELEEQAVTRIIVQGSTLEDFFTSALDYSPELRISRERLNISSARKRAANGQLMPQVNANASVSDNTQTQDAINQTTKYRGERYSLQLTQVLFNWQAFNARGRAYLIEEQSEAEYFGQLAFVLTDVAEKYFAVLQAQDAVTSVTAELDAVNRQLAQVESLYNLQAVQITDLYEVQARQAAVQAEQLNLESELAIAKEQLRAVSGVTVGELYRLDEEIDIPALEGSIESWLERARSGNHQILAREFAVQAADKRISESKGAYMPRVSLILNKQDSNIGFDNALQANRTTTDYIGVDVQIPIFTSGRSKAGVSEARSQHRIAENELRQIELEIIERTRTAYLQVKASELRVRAAERLAESTALSYTAQQRGFELGTVTSVDVLNALGARFRAERDLQRARYDHIRYNLLLKREAGTLSAEDLSEVGDWLVAPQN